MVRVSSPAKLRPWSESTAKMVMGVVPGLVNNSQGVSFAIMCCQGMGQVHELSVKRPSCSEGLSASPEENQECFRV